MFLLLFVRSEFEPYIINFNEEGASFCAACPVFLLHLENFTLLDKLSVELHLVKKRRFHFFEAHEQFQDLVNLLDVDLVNSVSALKLA
ncbi:hypothetical protein AQUCO_02500297v1 [Aquilegia coerulea]|uniref:Uncharacterized protein n=1 Tax=Aquilegia coerulea TaxID=218851 RepID=A0A2G5DAD0_AQUCA|nr:hypothetical protein AQUCO_02500297v1 [Aquilegia coerulea]